MVSPDAPRRRIPDDNPPRRRILPPMRSPPGSAAASADSLLDEAGPSNANNGHGPSLNPLVQFKDLLAKRGFNIVEVDLMTHNSHFIQTSEENTVCVKVMKDVDSFDSRYVGTDFLALFSPELNRKLIANREAHRRNNRVPREGNEVTVDGCVDDFDMLLRTVHPTQLPLQPGRMSIDHLVKIAQTSANMVNIGTTYLQMAVTFYLTLAMEVPTGDKFKLVSLNGDDTLLTSTLVAQCGKAEEVNDVVTDPVFQEIQKGPYASKVMAALLEHGARCSDDRDYLLELKKRNETLKEELQTQVQQTVDFTSLPTQWAQALKSGYCTITVGDQKLYASVWCLRAWSPVFQRMMSSTWETSGNIMDVTIPAEDQVTVEGVTLFLNLLHPSPKWALWNLLPEEVVAGLRASSTLDSLFTILFHDNDDLLNDVFRMAHKYQIGPLLELCVRLIESRSSYSLCDKFLLADSYHLPQLLARCLGNMTTTRTFRRYLSDSDCDFTSQLSKPVLQVIIDRLVEIG